jgi:hypothetical protein
MATIRRFQGDKTRRSYNVGREYRAAMKCPF